MNRWTPSVDSLERLGQVFGAYMSKYPSLWILLFIPVAIIFDKCYTMVYYKQ